MTIAPLTANDMETIRGWRNEAMETLRTPFMLTKEMQADYYRDVICNRDSRTRYWAFVKVNPAFGEYEFEPYHYLIGYGGLENIEWENSRAEISLLIGPDYRRKGYGSQAVDIILDQAFNYLNLHSVHGECYCCANVKFWESILSDESISSCIGGRGICESHKTYLLHTKLYNGKYHDSLHFTFIRGE